MSEVVVGPWPSSGEDLANWDSQLDRCLLNAASELSAIVTETFEERMGLAHGWMNLADSWMHRQDNEAQFEAWRDEHELEDVDA